MEGGPTHVNQVLSMNIHVKYQSLDINATKLRISKIKLKQHRYLYKASCDNKDKGILSGEHSIETRIASL